MSYGISRVLLTLDVETPVFELLVRYELFRLLGGLNCGFGKFAVERSKLDRTDNLGCVVFTP